LATLIFHALATLILIFPCFGDYDVDFSFATLILIFHALATFDFSLELCQGKATRNPYSDLWIVSLKLLVWGNFNGGF